MNKNFTIVAMAIIGVLAGSFVTASILTLTMADISAEYEETVLEYMSVIDDQKEIIIEQTACIDELRSTIEAKNIDLRNVMNHDWDHIEYEYDGARYTHTKEDGILGKLGFGECRVSRNLIG